MPNDGTGANWDETHPADGDPFPSGDTEIRDLRIGLRARLNKEHRAMAASTVGGEHIAGSAMVYIQSGTPTKRPDGSTTLDANDLGRLWYNTSNGNFYILTSVGPAVWSQFNAGGGGGGTPTKAALYQDLKTAGTDGGTFTQGVWQTRTLNSTISDVNSLGSLSGNVVTLASAGTYKIKAIAPAVQVDQHQARITITIDGTPTYYYGNTSFCNSAGSSWSESIVDLIAVVGGTTRTVKLEHLCLTTRNNSGFGYANNTINANWPTLTANSRVEVYSSLMIEKLS
jgi:hypothetical protein